MTQRILNAEPTPPGEIALEEVAPLDRVAAITPGRLVLPLMPPVSDQGSEGTCVAHAAGNVYGWHYRQRYGKFPELDRQAFYDLCKKVDGEPDPYRIRGTWLLTALRVMAGSGYPLTNGKGGPKIIGYQYASTGRAGAASWSRSRCRTARTGTRGCSSQEGTGRCRSRPACPAEPVRSVGLVWKNEPMTEIEAFFLGRTFDDFLFRPQHSPVRSRGEVDLRMPLVPGLELALPVLGANMDTVVGEEMAKTLALEGGLGFLHRNASIADQAARVRYVKTRHSHVIDQPLLLERTATIAEARQLIRKHNASSFLIDPMPRVAKRSRVKQATSRSKESP